MNNSPATTVDEQIITAISRRGIQNLMAEALKVIEEALSSNNLSLRVSTAKYIIDQSVGKAPQEIKSGGTASSALVEAASKALNLILETHPGLHNGVIIEPLPVLAVDHKVLEIGDPEQEP